MKLDISNRIRAYLHDKRISETQFAKKAELVQATVNKQLNGTSALSASIIESLALQFPDISMEWLIRGNGSMLLNDPAPSQSIVPNPPIGQPLPTESDALAAAMDLIEKQNEFIKAQSLLITQLKSQLNQ